MVEGSGVNLQIDRIVRCTFGCKEYQGIATNNPFAKCPRCGSPTEIVRYLEIKKGPAPGQDDRGLAHDETKPIKTR